MLRCFATSESVDASAEVGTSIQVTSSVILDVLKSAKPYRTDGTENIDWQSELCLCTDAKASEAAFVPLLLNNVSVGVLWSTRTEPNRAQVQDPTECMRHQSTSVNTSAHV